MKWTDEMVAQLRALCESGAPNREIAKELNVPIAEVYAKRSHLNITIDKVAAKHNPTMIKCDCCGFMIDADDAETYIMQDGSEQRLCERCAAVLEWERDFCDRSE